MKTSPPASNSETQRTVLMVDGHGQIRTIRKFRQKLFMGGGLLVCAVLAAVGAGWLFVDGLKTQRELQHQIDSLRDEVVAAEQQKELLLARALKAEAKIATKEPARTPVPSTTAAPLTAKAASDGHNAAPAVEARSASSVQKENAAPASPPKADAKPEPEVKVAVEQLKVGYRVAEKAVTTEFVIRNTGNTQAQGRAVVVLSAAGSETVPRLTLPSVPLKNDRPRGSRGRRFSISRFMRLKLQRKVAEPGLKFDTADIFVFDMQGKLLQEKTFEVAVSIPAEKPQPPAAVVSPAPPKASDPASNPAGNSIIAIPSGSEQESQGGQED